MKCPMCSVDATPGALFCQQCGSKLPTGDDSAALADPPQPLPAGTDSGGSVSARGRDVPEEVLWEGSYSPKAMLGTYVLSAVASVVLIGLGVWARGEWYGIVPLAVLLVMWIYVLGRLAVARLGVRYKLTNQMFYHQRGVLTRVTDRIELIEIHDVTCEQGLFDRVVNVGTIFISSNDRTNPRFPMVGVENVQEVAQKIDKARRGEQIRRGRRIESLGVHES